MEQTLLKGLEKAPDREFRYKVEKKRKIKDFPSLNILSVDFSPGLRALPRLECGRGNPQSNIPQCGGQQENYHCIKSGKHTVDQYKEGIDDDDTQDDDDDIQNDD